MQHLALQHLELSQSQFLEYMTGKLAPTIGLSSMSARDAHSQFTSILWQSQNKEYFCSDRANSLNINVWNFLGQGLRLKSHLVNILRSSVSKNQRD
jgi:hypothetical protein